MSPGEVDLRIVVGLITFVIVLGLWVAAGVTLVRLINWRWRRKRGGLFFHLHSEGDRTTAMLTVLIWPVVLGGIIIMMAFGLLFNLVAGLVELVGGAIIGGE